MTIEIFTAPIWLEIRQKSHLEVQDIQDVEARDHARAGLDKEDDIRRCIDDGFAQVARRCVRFLKDHYAEYADDTGYGDKSSARPTSHIYIFDFTARRGFNKEEALTQAMHDLTVQYALAKFYMTVNQGELSNRHSLAAASAAEMIDELLYYKKPPRV